LYTTIGDEKQGTQTMTDLHPIAITSIGGALIGFVVGILRVIRNTKTWKCEEAGGELVLFVFAGLVVGLAWFIIVPALVVFFVGAFLSYYCKKFVSWRHKNANRFEEI
jgi:H+/Cl- antiporter ClcA